MFSGCNDIILNGKPNCKLSWNILLYITSNDKPNCELLWREAVAGIVFSDVPISNCMNYATYCLIRFTIGVFYNIYTPFQQFGVLISLILP